MNIVQRDPEMRYALSQVKGMKTEGERRKWLDSYFGFDDDARRQHGCISCRDTGWAMVYHPLCLVQLSRNKPIEWHRKVGVRCNCQSARHVAAEDKRGNAIPMLGDRNWHIACNEPDSRAKLENFDLSKICDAKRYDEFEAYT